jgi:hypothetical protein
MATENLTFKKTVKAKTNKIHVETWKWLLVLRHFKTGEKLSLKNGNRKPSVLMGPEGHLKKTVKLKSNKSQVGTWK